MVLYTNTLVPTAWAVTHQEEVTSSAKLRYQECGVLGEKSGEKNRQLQPHEGESGKSEAARSPRKKGGRGWRADKKRRHTSGWPDP